MPRSNRLVMEGLINGSCKIRKRGCSSSSSSSSMVHNYRFKRAIVVGKHRGGSRSSTPVPTWKTTPLLRPSTVKSPEYTASISGGGRRSKPVSARKLAATLWEINEMPSPGLRVADNFEKRLLKKEKRLASGLRSVHSGSLPPHLSDPSHSPVSEMDRSGTGSRHRRTSSISQRHRVIDHNVGNLDSLRSASLMEIETRSRAQTSSGSVVGVRNSLKDVNNALTTSKELLKIINRVWAHADQPSSSMSLVSALHAELERARLQVNKLIQDQQSDQNEINYLMKRFVEEKAAWKNKEQKVVEAAIKSIAGELEVERKLRRSLESLNKKLGKELAETKTSFVKVVKELESQKRAREVMEQVCDEDLKLDSEHVHEKVEKEREMRKLADMLLEERVQMKPSEAKHQFDEKSAAIDKLRKQLEESMRNKRGKEKGNGSLNPACNEEVASYLSRTHFGSLQNKEKEDDDTGEMGVIADCDQDSSESDLHSIELNMANDRKLYKWAYKDAGRDSGRASIDDEMKGRNSISGMVPRRSSSLQRSISGGVEWPPKTEDFHQPGYLLDQYGFHGVEKQAQIKSFDEIRRYKSVKGFRDHILSSSGIGSMRDFASPTRQWGQQWSSLDPVESDQEKSTMLPGGGLKPRLIDAKGDGPTVRRSKR